MKRLIYMIAAVLAAIAICATYLVTSAVPKQQPPVDYTIYIFKNGSAEISVDNIARVIQTDEDIEADGMILKAGTVILPGNGNPIYYNYERHDNVTQKGR